MSFWANSEENDLFFQHHLCYGNPGGDAMEEKVILQDLPVSVKGFVFEGEDGDPVIVVNSRLTWEQNRKTFGHEQEHIRKGDMDNINYHEYRKRR